MRHSKGLICQAIFLIFGTMSLLPGPILSQEGHGSTGRDAIDKMRDRDLQPEKVLDAIDLRVDMKTGEAGASYGYFTFKMSTRVGNKGFVYANDIDPKALAQIDDRCKTEKIANIKTVLGSVEDPLFPERDLDMIVVFDCLFEFSKPAGWLRNTRKYLGPGGRLVIVDPDPAKIGGTEHFLSRKQVIEFAAASGYEPVPVDDSFLKTHMIIVLKPVAPSLPAAGRDHKVRA
jgi:ubiquinone/menaquinone biosynthesis C-methylase UbiE